MLSKLDLEPKSPVITEIERQMTLGTKKHAPKKIFGQGVPWCDCKVDADAEGSKLICRSPP